MAYTTVLVHLNDERRAERLLDFAVPFAQAQGAHLIGLYVVPLPVVLNEWPDIAIAEMIEMQRKSYREEGQRIAALFAEKTKGMSRPAEWRLIDSQYSTASEAAILQARTSDIAIVPEPDPNWHLSHLFDCAADIMLQSGRPVLVIPNSGSANPTPERITVAWNSRREATRAAFEAIPLMKKARATELVWLEAHETPSKNSPLRCAELAATLARHGVRVETKTVQTEDATAGEALLSTAKASNADLLVMGAYGHSRLREFVPGGATRHVLKAMALPVLFSH